MSYDFYSDGHVLDELIGKSVTAIHWSEDRLVFETDGGTFGFCVEGDCCSSSYFHDFFGVRHLLDNGAVVSVGNVDLQDSDPRFSAPVNSDPDDYDVVVRVYGYELVTNHPVFGEVTSVLSFRNYSNGYYGGWMDRIEVTDLTDLTTLADDYIGA